MCGRAKCTIPGASLASCTGVPNDRFVDMHKFTGGNNICPGSYLPIRTQDKAGSDLLQAMVWGLIPSFTSPDSTPEHFKMFNARSETVYDKPSFRKLMSSRRGVLYLNGYYEWKLEGKTKQPYYVGLADESLLCFACVFDTWSHSGSSEPLYSFSILTCDAHPSIAWLHDRQPFFLTNEKDIKTWTSVRSSKEDIEELLRVPRVPDYINIYPVTRKMSNVSYQGDDCSAPFSKDKDISPLNSSPPPGVKIKTKTKRIDSYFQTSPASKRLKLSKEDVTVHIEGKSDDQLYSSVEEGKPLAAVTSPNSSLQKHKKYDCDLGVLCGLAEMAPSDK